MFYTGDWMKDPNLSKCSAATRGIWMDLLCAMHENGRTGIITGTITELAQMCRCSEQEMRYTIVTLAKNEVAKISKSNARSQKVTVVNRRMNREHKVREATRLRAQRHRARSHGNADVTSPSSCSSSDKRIVSKDLSKSRESSSPTKKHSLSDSDFEEFQEAYSHIDDVRFVYDKQTRYLGRPPTRQEFLGWLNREIPNRKGNGPDDDRGSSEQIARVARSIGGDN
jgi:hypothetical protein